MARKKSLNLTEAEQRLMEVLWEKGSATVAEVTGALSRTRALSKSAALPKKVDLAYNTVLTTLRILESKGYLRHSKPKDGRAFLYAPVVSREQATHSALRHLLGRFFGNSAEALVLNLLEDEKLSEAERKRIRSLLQSGDSQDEGQNK